MSDQDRAHYLPLIKKAILLQKEGHYQQALPLYEELLKIYPDDAILLSNYGAALLKLYHLEEAFQVIGKALRLKPDLADCWSNLGNFYQLSQDYGKAIQSYQKCLELQSNHPGALSNLAMCISTLGHYDVAQQLYRLSIELEPENRQTRLNYAISLLASGNYKEGYKENEWRWTKEERKELFPPRPWEGQPLEGKTLLIYGEAGFGDMLQYSRFFPQMKKFGAKLIVAVPPELLSLFSYSFPELVFTSKNNPLPDYDYYVLLMSLPYLLGIELTTIPSFEGYLKAEPQKISFWREQIKEDRNLFSQKNGLRIGLVWSGSSHPEEKVASFANRRRSMDLCVLEPLAQAVPQALFYSLQIGDKAEQALTPPAFMVLVDHTKKLGDFSDTAALIMALDLVVSVDTSTAHLAAALGKPVLLLSRFDQCWRWLHGRQDTPWYQNMTIYQQEKVFDWSAPIEKICRDLKERDIDFFLQK